MRNRERDVIERHCVARVCRAVRSGPGATLSKGQEERSGTWTSPLALGKPAGAWAQCFLEQIAVGDETH